MHTCKHSCKHNKSLKELSSKTNIVRYLCLCYKIYALIVNETYKCKTNYSLGTISLSK